MHKYIVSARADGRPIIGQFFEFTANHEMIRIVSGKKSHRVIKCFGREIEAPEQVVPYELLDSHGKWIGGLEYNSGKIVLTDSICENCVDLLKALTHALSAKIVDKVPT